jgi:hypothetical protein
MATAGGLYVSLFIRIVWCWGPLLRVMSLPIASTKTEQPKTPNPWVLPARALTVFYGCPEMPRVSHYFLPRLLFANHAGLAAFTGLKGKKRFGNMSWERLFQRLAKKQ